MNAFRFLGFVRSKLGHASLWICLMFLATTQVNAQSVLVPSSGRAERDALALATNAIGARQCLTQISELSSLSVKGASNNDVLIDWDHKRMGAGPVFALVGLNYAGAGAALSVSAVPEANGTCSLAAERTSFEAMACKQVAKRELSGYHATPLLEHMTVYTDAEDAGSSVSLIDSPPGCIVIRRYVKFSAQVDLPAK